MHNFFFKLFLVEHVTDLPSHNRGSWENVCRPQTTPVRKGASRSQDSTELRRGQVFPERGARLPRCGSLPENCEKWVCFQKETHTNEHRAISNQKGPKQILRDLSVAVAPLKVGWTCLEIPFWPSAGNPATRIEVLRSGQSHRMPKLVNGKMVWNSCRNNQKKQSRLTCSKCQHYPHPSGCCCQLWCWLCFLSVVNAHSGQIVRAGLVGRDPADMPSVGLCILTPTPSFAHYKQTLWHLIRHTLRFSLEGS